MFNDNKISAHTSPIFGRFRLGTHSGRIWIAMLTIVAVFTTGFVSADGEHKKALVTLQVSEDGEILVTGSGPFKPLDKLMYVPENTLKLPKDVVDALIDEESYIEMVVVYEDQHKSKNNFRVMRCHRHAGGIFHCH